MIWHEKLDNFNCNYFSVHLHMIESHLFFLFAIMVVGNISINSLVAAKTLPYINVNIELKQ